MEPDRAPHVQLHHHELAAKPLTDLRTIIELIAATTTETGLAIQASYNPNWHPTGIKINATELAQLPLHPHDWHPEWNYTLNAQPIPA